MKTKILITGANGFIGRHLKQWLSVTKYKIYTTSREDGDISDEKYVKSLYAIKPHIIIHLAFDISREESYEVYLRQLNNNIKSMLLIAELAKACKSKLIIPSTVSLYSNNKRFVESNSINPMNVYSLTKYVGEQIIKIYKLENYLILRIGIVYGRDQNCNMLIPNIIKHINENKTIEIYGGDQTRDFLHVDDLCALIFSGMSRNVSGIYNVGYGKSYSIKQIIQIIEKLMGKTCLVKYTEVKNNEILNYRINTKQARKAFDWKPDYSLIQGLKDII